jgi:hypothetical protein
MAIIERAAQKEKEDNKAFIKNEQDKGPTLKEILANKEQSDLFGEYLKEERDGALAEKLISGNLDREDYRELGEKRKEFLEIMERSKNISDSLDTALISKLAEASPELKQVGEIYGPEAMRNAMKRHLPRIAITDRERFRNLDANLTHMQKGKEFRDQREAEIQEDLKEYGITEEEFFQLMQTGDAEEIAREIKKEYGWFKKRSVRLKDLKQELEDLAKIKSEDIKQYLRLHKEDMKDLGKALEATLLDNPIVHETLMADLRKDEIPKNESGMAFSELKSTTNPKKEDVVKEWEEFQKLHGTEFIVNAVATEEGMDRFTQEYVKKNSKGKGGFWAMFWLDLFSSNVKKMIKE